MNNRKLKDFILKIINKSGFNKLCYALNKNRKRIIIYHNIIPDDIYEESINSEFTIKESTFRKQVDMLEKRFKIGLDLEDTSQLTITFDDGYLNQYSLGSKILDEKNINGYFFCSESLINNGKTLGIDNIQFWLDYVPYGNYKIDKINLNLRILNKEDRKLAWFNIRNIINCQNINIEEVEDSLNKVYPFMDIKGNEKIYNLRFKPINKLQIEKMKSRGHIIGAHSSKHEILSKMSFNELDSDIETCRQNIGEIYNTDVFCYPYGSFDEVSEDNIKLVKEKNFKYGIASGNYPHKYRGYSKDYIPRMYIEDIENEDKLDFILSGAWYLLYYKRLLPKI